MPGNLAFPARKHGTSNSAEAWERESGHLPFPGVIKPIRSLGGVGISFVDSPHGFKKLFDESVKNFGPVVIQEKIPYDERYSVAILMDYSQSMRRCCVLKAIRSYPVETGPASFVETVDRPDLVTMAELLLQSIRVLWRRRD